MLFKYTKVIYVLMVFTILLSLSGCATKEKFEVQINEKLHNVDTALMQSLLSIVIDKRTQNTRFQAGNSCVYLNNHVQHRDTIGGYQDIRYNFKNCYKIKDNKITGYDYSSQRGFVQYSNGKRYKRDGHPSYVGYENYLNYLESLENDTLLEDLYSELQQYKIFEQKFLKHKRKRKATFKNISISFVDNTSVLPEYILKQLSKYKYFKSTRYAKAIDLYKEINKDPKKRKILNNYLSSYTPQKYLKVNNNNSSIDQLKDITNNFMFDARVLMDQVDRYKVSYDKYHLKENYIDFPKNVIFKITNVKFNFLPVQYVAHDKNINIEVINTPFEKKSIKVFKISNKTKKFIELETIAGYYGKDVYSNLLSLKTKIKIAPMSEQIISILNFPSKKMLNVTSTDQINQYGFSVDYKISGQTVTKSLYNVKHYSIKQLIP